MADIPGLEADVYFGDAATPLPDWRADLPEEDDEEPSEEWRRAVAGMLGFDPSELDDDTGENDGAEDDFAEFAELDGVKGDWYTFNGQHMFVRHDGTFGTGPLKGQHVKHSGDVRGQQRFHAARAAYHRKAAATSADNRATAEKEHARTGHPRTKRYAQGHARSEVIHKGKLAAHEKRIEELEPKPPAETGMGRPFTPSPFAKLPVKGPPPTGLNPHPSTPKRAAAAKSDAPSKAELPAALSTPHVVDLLTDTKAGPVHTKYDVTPSAAGFTFAKHGESGTAYTVRVKNGEVTGCDCPDSIHKSGRTCKHCRAAEKILAESQAKLSPTESPYPRYLTGGRTSEPTPPVNAGYKPTRQEPPAPTLDELKAKIAAREAAKKASREAFRSHAEHDVSGEKRDDAGRFAGAHHADTAAEAHGLHQAMRSHPPVVAAVSHARRALDAGRERQGTAAFRGLRDEAKQDLRGHFGKASTNAAAELGLDERGAKKLANASGHLADDLTGEMSDAYRGKSEGLAPADVLYHYHNALEDAGLLTDKEGNYRHDALDVLDKHFLGAARSPALREAHAPHPEFLAHGYPEAAKLSRAPF